MSNEMSAGEGNESNERRQQQKEKEEEEQDRGHGGRRSSGSSASSEVKDEKGKSLNTGEDFNEGNIVQSTSSASAGESLSASGTRSVTVTAQIEIPPDIKPIIPSEGAVIDSERLNYILCKPKLLPIKSITIEKLEKLQQTANERAKKVEQEEAARETLIN